MKIIRIMGGIGNQLFQYAYGRKLELSGKKIIFDISFYSSSKAQSDTARDFKLSHFNIETKASFQDIPRSRFAKLKNMLAKLNIISYGFYQSEKYFKDIEQNIRHEFTLKNPLGEQANYMSKSIISTKNSISLHIRRGDYANDPNTNSYHGLCDYSYYRDALKFITDRIGTNIHLFIFSDEIQWVKINMSFEFPTTYVSSPDIADYEEIHLMTLTDHHIIANSSFSWWGAWLDSHQNKIVIAPKRWTNKQQSHYKNIIPSEWKKI